MMFRVQLKKTSQIQRSIGAKERKYKTAHVENKTLPNLPRFLVIGRYMVVFYECNKRSGDKNFGYAVHDLADVG